LNLINNSIDAMEKRGGEIVIRTRLEKNHVVVEVADNGPGIARANLGRIFDPFFTTKPVGKGTGLGLSICYGIIKKYGGEIEVRSVPEKDTTFSVKIPLSKGKPDQNGQTPAGSENP
jgi:two-component system NtrC family sensor kinase